jgi:hypothetical protein
MSLWKQKIITLEYLENMRNNSQTVAPFAVNLNTTIRYHDKGKE